ncbi:hypothetical protein [Halomicrococcus sp. SG-WS-1]|uniref:hypothetical protein n=1 Tax=Halomicrococcus sp. SG-WS-1 TaxID=3439057 RepID=UPI003F78B02A
MSESERDIAAPISSELESRVDRAREWLLLDGNRLVVGLLPLSILFSYILRTATVTERTAAAIPFTTPEQEQ